MFYGNKQLFYGNKQLFYGKKQLFFGNKQLFYGKKQLSFPIKQLGFDTENMLFSIKILTIANKNQRLFNELPIIRAKASFTLNLSSYGLKAVVSKQRALMGFSPSLK